MQKQLILEKLGLTERGAAFILANKELCKRIEKETPMHDLEFAKEYDVPIRFVKRLIEKEVISHFANTPRKGSKTFIFVEETINVIGGTKHYTNYFFRVNRCLEVILPFYKKMYKGMEYGIISSILLDKKSYQEVAEIYGLTPERINQIFNRALRRTRRYVSSFKHLEELTHDISEASVQLEALKLFIANKQRGFNVSDDEIKQASVLTKSVFDLDLSVRALGCLKAAQVDTIGDLVKFEKETLMKFRNFGKKTLQELIDIVEIDLGLSFGMKDIPNYTQVNHFVQYLKENNIDIPEDVVEKFKLTL